MAALSGFCDHRSRSHRHGVQRSAGRYPLCALRRGDSDRAGARLCLDREEKQLILIETIENRYGNTNSFSIKDLNNSVRWNFTIYADGSDPGNGTFAFNLDGVGDCLWIQTNGTIGATYFKPAFGDSPTYLAADGSAGITATITTAKITHITGSNGSMTFKNGILTAQTQAT